MGHESKAANITPPVAGKNVWGLDAADLVGGTVWITTPDEWKSAIMRFSAQGEDFYITFGDSSLTSISAAAKSTIAANAISVQGSVVYHIPAGQNVDFNMKSIKRDSSKERFCAVGAAGTAGNILRVTESSGYING